MRIIILLLAMLFLQANQTEAYAQSGRRVLMEEFTGTWCNSCPRGLAAVKHLKAKYGDRFIPVAIHQESYDPMKTSLYGAADGYPSCWLNRGLRCDPFFGSYWTQSDPIGVIHDIDNLLSQNYYADIEVEACWINEEQTKIKVTTHTTFFADDEASNYAIGFIVTEDGMTGESSQWSQRNVYVNDVDWLVMPEMEPYVHGTDPLTGMVYDHVVIEGKGLTNGLSGSVSEIEKNVPQDYSYTINMANNNLIQDKTKLSVVAVLFNTYYHDVENVAECKVVDSQEATAITAPTTAKRPQSTAIYDLQGRKVGDQRSSDSGFAAGKGIYIHDGRKWSR